MRENVSYYDFRWFGAVGDKVTEDTAAMNKAFLACYNRGAGKVYIAGGHTFRKADTGAILKMYPGTTLCGEGDSSVIYHDDRPTNARRDMLQVQPSLTLGVSLRDFKIQGTVEEFTEETNQFQCLTGADFQSIFMSNVTIDGCRYMRTAFTRIKDVLVVGCHIKNSL